MNDFGMRLWESGFRSGVQQYFYDLPLNQFRSGGDGLLFASLGRETDEGPEASFFVVKRTMIEDAIASVFGAKLLDAGVECRISISLHFDVTAVLMEPMEDCVPFRVTALACTRVPRSSVPADADNPFLHQSGRDWNDDEEGYDDEDDEEDEEWDENYFPIALDFRGFIERLPETCDLLLKRVDLEPREISLLAKLKYALSRLPMTTRETGLDVVLSYHTDDHGSWSGVSLELTPELFSVVYVGYVHGPFGGDSESQIVYTCENGGFRSDLSDDVGIVYVAMSEWLSRWEAACSDPDVELTISDAFETFDWEQLEDTTAWDGMPTNYG